MRSRAASGSLRIAGYAWKYASTVGRSLARPALPLIDAQDRGQRISAERSGLGQEVGEGGWLALLPHQVQPLRGATPNHAGLAAAAKDG